MIEISVSDEAVRWASILEDRERARSGHPLALARKVIARRLKIAPGTLENLRRGRSKGVRAWIYEALRAEMIRELTQEQKRLAHELDMVRQSGGGAGSGTVTEIEKHLGAIKALVSEGRTQP